MGVQEKYLAFDFGGESGRAVLGSFDGTRLQLQDVHRFPNGATRILDTLYWDPLRLFAECKQGLKMAVEAHGPEFAGIGIDTWGVDFALLGRGDVLLGNPRHYRDHGNDGMLEAALATLPRDLIFARTGAQFSQINTLYQLLALKRQQSPVLEQAQTLLMMADLFNFWFTGIKANEFTIATTTQMIDPVARAWAPDLLEGLGLPAHLVTDLVDPGTVLGTLRQDIAEECRCGAIPVIAPGEHDTASAVVAVPATTPDYAYISSGTWSLMGIEVPQPHISPQIAEANFTNEGGVCGTTRLLKNIMGLWLIQGCRRAYARQGQDHSYAELTTLAEAAPPFGALLEPDDARFLSPTSMPAAVAAFCAQTGQPVPQEPGVVVRCCLESLALKYRWVLEKLESFRGKRIPTIHIVGGGAQNRLLCQLAADATQRTVVAGPIEATAMGNILMQALGRGHLGSLDQAREVVRQSCALETYTPAATAERWEEAYQRFLHLRAVTGNTQ